MPARRARSSAGASFLSLTTAATRAGQRPASIASRMAWRFDPRPDASTPRTRGTDRIAGSFYRKPVGPSGPSPQSRVAWVARDGPGPDAAVETGGFGVSLGGRGG